MIAGHFATALLPKARHPELPMVWLLTAAQLADFLWIVLGFLGIEAPEPASLLDATFANIRVQMTFSHDVLPTLGAAACFGAIVLLAGKGRRLAGWCAALVLLHLGCDLVSGFEHHLCGPSSPAVGLATYTRAPHVALAIETLVSLLCVTYYDAALRHRGTPLARGRRLALYGVLVGGILIWWPTATIPPTDMLHLR